MRDSWGRMPLRPAGPDGPCQVLPPVHLKLTHVKAVEDVSKYLLGVDQGLTQRDRIAGDYAVSGAELRFMLASISTVCASIQSAARGKSHWERIITFSHASASSRYVAQWEY